MTSASPHRLTASPPIYRRATGSMRGLSAGRIIAVLIGALLAAPALAAAPAATVLLCTNAVSHASWRIHIDFARSTVDSNPARISDVRISWHDRTDGGNYTLDRQSGELTVVIASSTGGYFLHDRCAPEESKARP
ncbi:MAG TPA: hypothetical protein VMD06_06915 [Steroidobacteraceae bacterium]|nr:hypothetical protein [Steroidobacteraceae bacterium]